MGPPTLLQVTGVLIGQPPPHNWIYGLWSQGRERTWALHKGTDSHTRGTIASVQTSCTTQSKAEADNLGYPPISWIHVRALKTLIMGPTTHNCNSLAIASQPPPLTSLYNFFFFFFLRCWLVELSRRIIIYSTRFE